ncbi:hypothetical protein EPD60_09630 [Flaviaesturariibacter flavus]|uniref:Uncharacterized protein n=1 Tax=Flaviaesturariibacter flavus TaxID=2502780 RepID=A0A4R1BBA4_9BACT|nr:OST5 family protein [Flaviaesturariibacter flavus]TCJ14253.1 hypothetical protein EPD60_09630 [Flaviaesturariibacter flavus]
MTFQKKTDLLDMYRTLYDIRTEGMPTSLRLFFLIGVAAVLIGGLLLVSWKGGRRLPVKEARLLLVGSAFALFGSLFLVLSVGSMIFSGPRADKIFAQKLFRVVEGFPLNYHPMPKEGHDEEKFEIQGISFHYSDYDTRFGYDNAASHGGVIHPGNYYRITYYPDQDSLEAGGPAILKIEIKDSVSVRPK